MEKVRVSKELATAIEKALDDSLGDKEHVLSLAFEGRDFEKEFGTECKILNRIEPLKLAEYLINGYVAVKSPEEIVIEMYRKKRHISNTDPANKWEADAYANGISFTLATLGIEIEGMNKVGGS